MSATNRFATQAIHNKTDLLNYLSSLEGKGVISGQYVIIIRFITKIPAIQSATGQSPGALGIDYYWFGQAGLADTSTDANAEAWWANRGLVGTDDDDGYTIAYAVRAPANGGVYHVPGNQAHLPA